MPTQVDFAYVASVAKGSPLGQPFYFDGPLMGRNKNFPSVYFVNGAPTTTTVKQPKSGDLAIRQDGTGGAINTVIYQYNGTVWKTLGPTAAGTVSLAGGTATVSTTVVTASSRIFLTSQADGGAPGFLRVSARSAGTSFTITSSSNTDTSSVAWMIWEP